MPSTPNNQLPRLSLTGRVPTGLILAGLILIVGIIGLGIGCGKKDLPVAPNSAPPPTVSDLQGTIENKTIVLSWTVPGGVTAVNQGLSEFKVFRFHQALEAEVCPDCPVPFRAVGRIPADEMNGSSDGALSGRYTEPAVPGQVYRYHVVGYGRGDRAGDKSNIVRIVCPSEYSPETPASPDTVPAPKPSGDH